MKKSDIERAISLGIESLSHGLNKAAMAADPGNFHGLLALRTVTHHLLGDKSLLYAELDGYLKINIHGLKSEVTQ